MQSFYDYKKFAVLYVDDEELSLKYFTKALESDFRVYTASNAEQALRIIDELKDDLALVLSDQRMPGMHGVELLEKCRLIRPKTLRILVTAYTDLDAAISAINRGAIYKYISKPWEPSDLYTTVQRAMEFFLLQRERDHLLREKLSALHNMVIADRVVSLGVLAAGLSTHLRNALLAIRTFIDLAPAKLEQEQVDLDRLRNPDFWKDFYEHVQKQLKRITAMVSDLATEPVRRDPPFQDRIRLADATGKVLGKMQSRFGERQISIVHQIPSDLPELTVDSWKFHRLLELLLANELLVLPPNSELILQARTLQSASGEEVQLELLNDGPGFPDQSLRSLFDPFAAQCENPQEFGINLMTCYFLAYHHGGRIEINRRADSGAQILLTFPTTIQPADGGITDQELLSKVLLNEALWEKLLENS